MKTVGEKALEMYKEMVNEERFSIPYRMLCYGAVDSFVDEPTDDEYHTIAEASVRLFLDTDDISLLQIADNLADKYANNEVALAELKTMTKNQLLSIID